MHQEFIHLQVQSEFSIENSTIRIKKLIQQAKLLKMPAIALTDNNNMFGAIKFYREAVKEKIKPIFGATITLEDDSKIILLCMNRDGYLNLSKLISLSYRKQGKVFISKQELFSLNENLILINTNQSLIARLLLTNKLSQAETTLNEINANFKDRCYIGILRSFRHKEEEYLHSAVALGIKTKTPIVALGDAQFLQKNDFEAHEARVCISAGGLVDDDKRARLYSREQYLKSSQEMCELFNDIPAAIDNSLEISKRCSVHFDLDKKNYLPQFPTPSGVGIAEFFTSEVKSGLDKIIKKYSLNKEQYYQRLEFELGTIVELDFSGYFLIVADFIAWSKENDIPVGPGRGSGAGSLVAYSLGITGVDPLKYDLLFERFLNPERVSMPDFDIDFAPHGRDKVIDYVSRKYGRSSVSQIITFGTMGAKGVVRDVGRVLGHPYGFSDRISKLIPNDLDITIDKALNYEENLAKKAEKDKKDLSKIKSSKEQELRDSFDLAKRYSSEEAVTSLIDLAKDLEGMTRHAGTHAGGVIIAPGNISDFCPTYKGLGDSDVVVTQFDKKDVEAVGLVKFDFLGLSNLSVIQKTVKLIAKNNLADEVIDIDEIPLDDDKVYELYRNGDTTGIFQMESRGMREYLKRLKPTALNDVVAMNALYRPGAMDYVDNYIAVKHGKEVEYPHPILEEILAPTNGVFVYQEQVMRAAQKMAGFSLGGADLLRRAMGYKNPDEMAKQRQNFLDGALEINGVDEDKANEVFDYIDKFAGYGFNKSHSVAYALVSYQTAWLKTHFRPAFMSAVISGVMGDTDRVEFMVDEIISSKIKIISPCINLSTYDFSLNDKQDIIYGFGAIKGVGEAFIEQVIINRGDGYKNLFDFCDKIEKKYLNKRALEALIHSGSFDIFKQSRATLLASYSKAVRGAEIKQKEKASGQFSLFANNHIASKIDYEKRTKHEFRVELEAEKIVLGFYFSGHPTDEYRKNIDILNAKFPRELKLRGAKDIRVIAMITHIFYKETKKGQMATLVLSDGTKKIDVMLFNKTLMEFGDRLEIGKIIVANCTVMKNYNDDEKYKDFHRISINDIDNAEIVLSKYAKYFSISLQKHHNQQFIDLKNILLQNPGTCPVVLHYKVDNIVGSVTLSDKYNVFPNKELNQKIAILFNDKISNIAY